MEVFIGDVNYKDVGLTNALLNYKSFTLIGRDNNEYFDVIDSFLKISAPKKANLFGEMDFVLDKLEQKIFREEVFNFLSNLIFNKEDLPEGAEGDIKRVLGKNIRIHLKDRADIYINTFHKLYQIVENCLEEDKAMYFLIVVQR